MKSHVERERTAIHVKEINRDSGRGINSYKTDEGCDVSPAILHKGERTITNHVRDVIVEAVCTFWEIKKYIYLDYQKFIKVCVTQVVCYVPYTQPMLTDWQRERRSRVVPLQTWWSSSWSRYIPPCK